MRTTLNIDDDVLQAVKELARRQEVTVGQIVSRLARRGLLEALGGESQVIRNGVPALHPRAEIITLERLQGIIDSEGV
jgi:hypothetical protein